LRDLGARVIELPSDEQCPDCCFLEDTALVLEELAIITRPGSEPRRNEVSGVAPTVMKFRNVVRIDSPGMLEAGDVLCMGRNLLVGISTRTNRQGIEILRKVVKPYGYEVLAIPLRGALHLKSVCTSVDDHTLLANPRHFDSGQLSAYKLIEVPAEDAMAANVLRINGTVCIHAGFHQTIELLRGKGFNVRTVNISEFLKAEAGLTCMSIILDVSNPQLI
jgi:dimethylargininase